MLREYRVNWNLTVVIPGSTCLVLLLVNLFSATSRDLHVGQDNLQSG